jgi:PIN domain nuclease of toxin-antitoxin system
MRLLPILNHHARLAGELPMHYLDPFDRMLIAQAKSENLTLMTADRTFKSYDVEILWSGR